MAVCSAYSDMLIAPYFQDNMLLQQDAPVTIWGTGAPGQRIDVDFCGEHKSTVVDPGADWALVMTARKADGSVCTLRVNDRTIRNIHIGDVWLAAGQSNMVRPLKGTDTYDLFAKAEDPKFLMYRYQLQVPLFGGYSEEQLTLSNPDDLFEARWQPSTGNEKGQFSGVAWHFGRVLRASLDIPIGVIQVSVGGSSMAEWIRLDTLRSDPRLVRLVENWPDDPMVNAGHRKRLASSFQKIIEAGDYTPYNGSTRFLTEPSMLFDSGIRPLHKVAFKGVIWYQGEANSDRPRDLNSLLPMLVQDWRSFFGQGDFPFYYVQLPSFRRETWPEFREIQRQLSTTIPNSGMVVTIDLGLENNIHPTDKQPIGERLAWLALSESYGKDVAWQSPVPVDSSFSDENLILTYAHYGKGLQFTGERLLGFEVAVCGAEFNFSEAEIVAANQVRLMGIPENVATVRYAYKPYARETSNLFSSNGLPAAPVIVNIQDCGDW